MKKKCLKCGGVPEIHGQDPLDTHGPYFVSCGECWESTDLWAYKREAWAQWANMNRSPYRQATGRQNN